MAQQSYGISCLDFIHSVAPANHSRDATARRTFRETLTRILRAEADGTGASDTDLAVLNDLLTRATVHRGVVSTVRGYGWGWRRDPGPELAELFPAAWSAAALLTSDDRFRLKMCAECGRLFYDESRNRSRRWCDMQGCGNRAKARRFRDRTQKGRPTSS